MGNMNAFRMSFPKTVEEAVSELPRGRGLDEFTRTRVLAGGQDLLTEMKEHLVEPEKLVNLKGVEGLDEIRELPDGGYEIGALVKIADIARYPGFTGAFAAIAEAAESVGSPQIRNAGTLGGNLCQRPRCWYYRSEDTFCMKKGGTECYSFAGENKYNAILGGGPSYIVHPSDLAPALVCLGAEVVIAGPRGERIMELDRFFTLPSEGSILRENVLRPEELVLAVRVPAQPANSKSTYLKFRERDSFDFAMGAVALRVEADGGQIRSAGLCLGAVAPIPWRALGAEEWLAGKPLERETFVGAGEPALAGAKPLSNNGYKIPLTRGLLVRAGETLMARIQEGK